MIIEPLIHRCVVQSGPAAGNKTAHEVTEWNIRFANKCEHCGQLLGDPEEVLAHIYAELTQS